MKKTYTTIPVRHGFMVTDDSQEYITVAYDCEMLDELHSHISNLRCGYISASTAWCHLIDVDGVYIASGATPLQSIKNVSALVYG